MALRLRGSGRGRSLDPMLTRMVAALLGAALLGWAGVRVMRVGDAKRAELRRAEAALASFEELRRKYTPAVAAESISWRRTLMELQDLGIIGDERLRMTQSVARAAETAGLEDVRVVIGGSDTTGSDKRLSTEGIQRKAASFGLTVECRGGLRSVIAFLGQLPPSVSPTQLNLVRQDGRRRHHISLAVYELTFSNGSPPFVWSSLERDDPGRGGNARPGG
jgi:hypothetical protein